jgi:hypothetical protein
MRIKDLKGEGVGGRAAAAYLKTGREGDGRTRFRRVWSRRAVSHRFAVRRCVPRYPSIGMAMGLNPLGFAIPNPCPRI